MRDWYAAREIVSEATSSVQIVPDNLEIVSFPTVGALWSWLEQHHQTHPGVWVRLQKSTSSVPSVRFDDVLEAGIAYGWSESTRRRDSSTAYLQKFTPRRTRGTTSDRNDRIADRLESDGKLTPAGRRALGRQLPTGAGSRSPCGWRDRSLQVQSTAAAGEVQTSRIF